MLEREGPRESGEFQGLPEAILSYFLPQHDFPQGAMLEYLFFHCLFSDLPSKMGGLNLTVSGYPHLTPVPVCV